MNENKALDELENILPAQFADHPQVSALFEGEAVELDSRLSFSCRGCGHLCCANTEILVSPPEAARIMWHLSRQPDEFPALKQFQDWAELYVGESSGLPTAQLRFAAFNPNMPDFKNCVFMQPVFDKRGNWQKLALCGIHAARPAVCRLFPVGRYSLAESGAEWRYRIVSRCPGFKRPPKGAHTPRGYQPPSYKQTVRDWVTTQAHHELDAEKDFFLFQVMIAFAEAQVRATTEGGQGLLTDDEVITLGRTMFFALPPAPPDPAQDHQAIMDWLALLRALVPEMRAKLDEIGRR